MKKKIIVIFLAILCIGFTIFIINRISNTNKGDENAIELINKYWNGYKSYNENEMNECFYGNYKVKNHTSLVDTGYFYKYAEPIIKYKKEEIIDNNKIYIYSFKCKYEAGTNVIQERGKITSTIKLIKPDNSDNYYIYEEPIFK